MIEIIKKELQLLARLEKAHALEKMKKRRADTRIKIELGGLVIKSGINTCDKSIVLGALNYSLQLIQSDKNYLKIFQSMGDNIFQNKLKKIKSLNTDANN